MRGKDADRKKLLLVLMVGLLLGGVFLSGTSLSGYQSITANWYEIRWPDAQDQTTHDLVWTVDSNTVLWDGDDTQEKFADGMTDLNTYYAEIGNPAFVENINYHEWWINDTVTASNPTGEARHFEWSIDLYTMVAEFRVTGGVGGCVGVEFWAELQNNVNSVFEILGAEKAASYVIYAQTEEYVWIPESAPHHIIGPTVSNFELHFLDANTMTVPAIQDGSDLNFEQLEPYSHVGIMFEFIDFGAGQGDTQPTVNMLIELNVLTVGRFDYVLTYVEGGEPEVGPRGDLGIFDSIGAALDAGFNALMDGFTGALQDVYGPLIMIAIVGISIVLIVYILKSTVFGVAGRRNKQKS